MSSYPASLSGDDVDDIVPSTPTPHSHLHRSMSYNSTRRQHQGTSYSQQSARALPTPILVRNLSSHSMNRGTRSTSTSSLSRGLRDDELFSEDDEDQDPGEQRRRYRNSADDMTTDEQQQDEQDAEDPITLKDRQSLINTEHPFGLPIWKPSLYQKSRSVTRYADEALHSIPSAQAERHLLPGNLFWAIAFGWWLALACFVASAVLSIVPQGGSRYSSLLFGLGWYIAWPFGKYVEGEGVDGDYEEIERDDDDDGSHKRYMSSDSGDTIRGAETIRGSQHASRHVQTLSWDPVIIPGEQSSLLQTISEHNTPPRSKSYGATLSASSSETSIGTMKVDTADLLGKICFWVFMVCLIAPLLLLVCIICWALVVTIPMAKLNWMLLKHLFSQPDTVRFCAAPPAVVVADEEDENQDEESAGISTAEASVPHFSIKHPRISAGQVAPSGSSKVLLCTYRAVGLKYYKYTVGGVNILFVNLMPIVFLVIIDGMILMPMVERMEEHHKHVPAFLEVVTSKGLIFVMSLLSVIPLSYFIGMAVASISAQSSIGMGAVINATFGSIIEIILYSLALVQGKGHLVEGSIVGSLLAGVLLMPGMSMVSSALRRKEQKFNAKSAGVTSMMLIMAIIGTLAPTLFYQVFGNFQLICKGCPSMPAPGRPNMPWVCDQCYYKHPDPADDPFYQTTVKKFIFFCAIILVLSYLIGLWFSLRTHASQIWQNPHEVCKSELPLHQRQSLYHRLAPVSGVLSSLTRRESHPRNLNAQSPLSQGRPSSLAPCSPSTRHISYAPAPQVGLTPILQSVDQAVDNSDVQSMHLPGTMTKDDFTRAVTLATASALRHHQAIPLSPAPPRVSVEGGDAAGGDHGGHDAPAWSRTTSATVLMSCTLLYAIIAEILVDVVDVILEGSGIQEKFLGVTLFALVPNTTEFMNAMSFALNGNIALSMEIGSAYALQVCLLQIPAMIAFSVWWAPEKMGEVAKTFTLIFPRWDVIAIILSMFLMTYTYIEARSNYHRGSILILSYLVLTAGFYFAPSDNMEVDSLPMNIFSTVTEFAHLTKLQYFVWYLFSEVISIVSGMTSFVIPN